jgi:hypothetical protein
VTKPKTQTDAERAETAAAQAEGAAQTAVSAATRAEEAVAVVTTPSTAGAPPFVGVGDWHTLGTATSAPLTKETVLSWTLHTGDFRVIRDWPERPAGCVDEPDEDGWRLLVQAGQWVPWSTTHEPDGRKLMIRGGFVMDCGTGVYEHHALAQGKFVEEYPGLFIASIDWEWIGKVVPGEIRPPRPPKPAPVTVTVEERY